jgi:hypothetical protein
VSDPHFTRDYVWVVITSLGSFTPDWDKVRGLGITGIYLNAADPSVTAAKILEVRGLGFKVGVFYPAHTEFQFGADVARAIDAYRRSHFLNDGGQTPVLLDFEPSDGSVGFWTDFISTYRSLLPGRVTDFTPEPFKAQLLPVSVLLNARFDVKVQDYFGDMSPVDAYEAGLDWVRGLNGVGYPPEQIRGFVDGGRKNKPPIFYEGRRVRNLLPGTCIWNANLLREAGLI